VRGPRATRLQPHCSFELLACMSETPLGSSSPYHLPLAYSDCSPLAPSETASNL
jgi:hypothetical protein